MPRWLCRAWHSSTDDPLAARLPHRGRPACGSDRGELVAVRLWILEELERRDADGFRSWFAAGARPGGDPAPVPGDRSRCVRAVGEGGA